jgi:hypothetical protein
MTDSDNKDDTGDATLLVSEFPPPPWYYQWLAPAASTGANYVPTPESPQEALANGTRRTAAAAARARELAEQQQQQQSLQNQQQLKEQRQQQQQQQQQEQTASSHPQSDPSSSSPMAVDDKTGAILGGVAPPVEEEGDVVAIFGEIVEDPLLVQPVDTCEDPQIVKENVQRLNGIVLRHFVKLVQDLVHQPSENKYVSAVSFWMLIFRQYSFWNLIGLGRYFLF